MGRTLGLILIGIAVVALILIVALVFTPVWTGEGGTTSGAVLGFVLFTAVIVLPLAGAGVFLLIRGNQEAEQMAYVRQQRQLLNIVKSRGQIDIGDLVIELNATRDSVQAMIHDLVGKGLYSGYINWDEGMLYSEQAAQLRDITECRNCGGQVDLVGKGVVQCPYCSTEYFLT